MAHATTFEFKDATGIADGVGGAWKRLWRRKPRTANPWTTTGVTYRGYMGVDGDAPLAWATEQHVKETQALLRMAAAAGRLGAWAVELAGMTTIWSDEVKAIHDLPPTHEPRVEDALAHYTPDSRQRAFEALQACANEGRPFDLELEIVTARGRAAWIRIIGEADRDAEGGITHVRGAIQDISRFRAIADEARRTAERFTRTLEGLSDGFVLLDHDWRFIYLNGEAERILRRPRAQLIGQSLLKQFPETGGGKFLKHCEDAMRAGRSVEFEKYSQGLGIWVYMKLSPSDQGLTVCIRDDSERMATRRELLALKAQLARASAPA